jgi:glycerophosphoryl diester phosphodiesterase
VVTPAGVEYVAHRAGNETRLISPAIGIADAVELDVHLFRGRLEVRHAKVVWPFRRYWERWRWVPDPGWHELHEINAASPAGIHLWVDVKGVSRRVTRRVLAEVGNRRPLTLSCRSWWALQPAERLAGVRTLRSVGSARQRWLVQRLPVGACDGVVMHERLADPRSVAALRRRYATVVVWAIEDLDRAQAVIVAGVDGIIADDLALLAAIRNSLNRGPTGAD